MQVKREPYSHTVGNEDRVPVTGAYYRPCLLFQPHDVSAAVPADVGFNSILRAYDAPRYPMDYATLEYILNNYVTNIGNTSYQYNQRFLIDYTARYTFTSMSNAPFDCTVVRWYCKKGLPSTVFAPATNATILNTYNIINLLGLSCFEYGTPGGSPDASATFLYNNEMIDTIVSNRNRFTGPLGVRFKKINYVVAPGQTINSVVRKREFTFSLSHFFSNTGTLTNAAQGNARLWFIPPGARGIFYIVRGHNAGVTLAANTTSVSYQSHSTMTYTTPAFAHQYQVKYGLRHIPETQRAVNFLTDTGVTLPAIGAGQVELEQTDAATAQTNAI